VTSTSRSSRGKTTANVAGFCAVRRRDLPQLRTYVGCDSTPVCCACQDPSTIYCSFSSYPAQIGTAKKCTHGTNLAAEGPGWNWRGKNNLGCKWSGVNCRKVVHLGCMRESRRRAIWEEICVGFPQKSGQRPVASGWSSRMLGAEGTEPFPIARLSIGDRQTMTRKGREGRSRSGVEMLVVLRLGCGNPHAKNRRAGCLPHRRSK
jgi:hypothetical protein